MRHLAQQPTMTQSIVVQQTTVQKSAVQPSTLQVRDAMTVPTAWIAVNATLEQAAFIASHDTVSELMVLDDAGHFVGVLAISDILRSVLPDIDEILAEGGSTEAAFRFLLHKGQTMAALPILPLINQEPFTVEPEDPIAKAATLLAHAKVSVLPVLQNGELVGILSTPDICLAILRRDGR